MLYLQLSGVQAFIDFSVASILRHALKKKKKKVINANLFNWFKK